MRYDRLVGAPPSSLRWWTKRTFATTGDYGSREPPRVFEQSPSVCDRVQDPDRPRCGLVPTEAVHGDTTGPVAHLRPGAVVAEQLDDGVRKSVGIRRRNEPSECLALDDFEPLESRRHHRP